ncbi:MAG: hypothetical protein GX868_10905 [Actinobacteria bacterium]|nr:hypothetical protein [Actinomycetota bacterium]
MDPAQFFTAPRLTIVAGKGGVGKTTVAATLALAAARVGLDVLIVEIEGKSGLPVLFGRQALTYDEVVLYESPEHRGRVRARTLTPDAALIEFLGDHGMKRLSKRLADTGALDIVATATPGIKDVLILGKVKQLERSGNADLIIVDAPAAGHAITFLSSARGLLDAVHVGPIETQAREVSEMLTDADRCQVVLVTLPEETPVNELIETAYNLEDRIGVKLGPVVINGEYATIDGLDTPADDAAEAADTQVTLEVANALEAAARFRIERSALQAEQIERLARQLPLPQLRLPFVFRTDLDLEALIELADSLVDQVMAS